MHAEWGEIGAEAAEAVAATLAAGGRVIPVGTTALRLLETAATGPRRIAPWRGETDIFIRPGYAFRIADGLMTNFHLPKSTLLMLVSALMGMERSARSTPTPSRSGTASSPTATRRCCCPAAETPLLCRGRTIAADAARG